MKRTPRFTFLSLALNLLAIYFIYRGNQLAASLTAAAAYMMVLREVPTLTTYFQFIVLWISALVVGQSFDYGREGFPLLTAATFLFASGCLLRLVFFRQMTHSNYLWLEPVILLLGIACYISGNLLHPLGWSQWVLPLLPMAFAYMLISGFVKEGSFYNKQAKKNTGGVQLGQLAPDFELADQDGNRVKLSDFRNKRSVLLIFVRGDWCPACHMMLRTYEKSREKFQEKNVMLLSVGPDPVGINKDMAMRLGLDFRILSDKQQQTAKVYSAHTDKDPVKSPLRVEYEDGLPLPASFLICPDGIIRYKSKADNVGEFLDPSLIFSVLDKLRKSTAA